MQKENQNSIRRSILLIVIGAVVGIIPSYIFFKMNEKKERNGKLLVLFENINKENTEYMTAIMNFEAAKSDYFYNAEDVENSKRLEMEERIRNTFMNKFSARNKLYESIQVLGLFLPIDSINRKFAFFESVDSLTIHEVVKDDSFNSSEDADKFYESEIEKIANSNHDSYLHEINRRIHDEMD